MATVSITRFLPAPCADVWQAFVDVDRFTEWFWPPRLAPVVVLDVRPGGEWRVTSSVAGMGAFGNYGELDEPNAMTFSWQWDADPEVTSVIVRFDPGELTKQTLPPEFRDHLRKRLGEALATLAVVQEKV